jgi:hypothetical protein
MHGKAGDKHIEWWRDVFFPTIPTPHDTLDPELRWKFSLPNPAEINANASAEAVDVYDTTSGVPDPALTHEVCLHKHFTLKNRQAIIRHREEQAGLSANVNLKEGQLVAFLVDDGFRQLAKEQTGMHDNATDLPFSIGQVVNPEAGVDNEGVTVVTVKMFYAADGGDPNKGWLPWMRDANTDVPGAALPAHWVKEIPKTAIFYVDVEWTKGGPKHKKRLSAATKEAIATSKGLPYAYLRGKGLMLRDEATRYLEQNVQDTEHGKSRDSIRRNKKAKTALALHQNTHPLCTSSNKRQASLPAEQSNLPGISRKSSRTLLRVEQIKPPRPR